MMNLRQTIKNFLISILAEKPRCLKEIISVDPGKITAVNTRGDRIEIDTRECRVNFYRELMGQAYTVTGDDKMIGERNCMSEPKYILFYSTPVYYIELEEESYAELRDKLESRGLQTFDVT